jgi:hypothetical protein
MHSTYTAFKQGVLTENTGRKMWPARKKHTGGVLGQLFNIGGMGLIIRFRYEFQDIVLLSKYQPGRSYLTQPASAGSANRY